MEGNNKLATQVGFSGAQTVHALLEKLGKEFHASKPKQPTGPPPKHILEQKGISKADEHVGMGPMTPPEMPKTLAPGAMPHRGPAPRRSALKKSGAHHRNHTRRIRYANAGELVNLLGVQSYRDCLPQLWYISPGALVLCDGCQKEVPQAMGSMQGAPGQSQFAQNRFICCECAIY